LPLDNRKNKFYLNLYLLSTFKQLVKAVYEFNVLLSDSTSPAVAGNQIWLPGWLEAINSGKNDLFLKIGPGDFLVHHAIALGLHYNINSCERCFRCTWIKINAR
jgi:hypothetical protein